MSWKMWQLFFNVMDRLFVQSPSNFCFAVQKGVEGALCLMGMLRKSRAGHLACQKMAMYKAWSFFYFLDVRKPSWKPLRSLEGSVCSAFHSTFDVNCTLATNSECYCIHLDNNLSPVIMVWNTEVHILLLYRTLRVLVLNNTLPFITLLLWFFFPQMLMDQSSLAYFERT